jgi:glutathione peroxidase
MLLTEQTAENIRGPVRWNFTKFLVDPKGNVVNRFGSTTRPMDSDITKAIEAQLP